MYVPKASPAISSPPFDAFFPLSSRPHSQSGYSLSSIAIGGSLPLKYPNPFKGIPAGTELFGLTTWSALPEGGSFGGDDAFVVDVESSCIAEVEVTAGGPSWSLDGVPRPGVSAAARLGELVEKSRLVEPRDACSRNMHLWQIIAAGL
jgi:hypothetical protein